KMVLDHPGGVDADAVGQLALLDGLLEHRALGILVPGPGQLVLEEEADLHRALPVRRRWAAATGGPRRRRRNRSSRRRRASRCLGRAARPSRRTRPGPPRPW